MSNKATYCNSTKTDMASGSATDLFLQCHFLLYKKEADLSQVVI